MIIEEFLTKERFKHRRLMSCCLFMSAIGLLTLGVIGDDIWNKLFTFYGIAYLYQAFYYIESLSDSISIRVDYGTSI